MVRMERETCAEPVGPTHAVTVVSQTEVNLDLSVG